MVLGLVFGSLVFKFGFSGLLSALSSQTLRPQICEFGSRVSMTAGILGTVIGLIQGLTLLGSLEVKTLGLALSIGLTTIFYGYLMSLGFQLLNPRVGLGNS